MTLLHTMSLSGSIAVGIYLLSYFLTKRYLSILWHKVYLTVNIFLFLVPFAYFKIGYTKLIKRYFGVEAWYQRENVVKNIGDFTIFVYEDGIYATNLRMYIILLTSVLMGIVGLIIFMKRYTSVYQKIMKEVVQFDRGYLVIKELMKGRKRQLKSKVYLCTGLKTPITIGIIHRKIVLPNIEWEEDRLRNTLKHELIHVCNMDNLVKMILLLAVILNFYNPVVYYLWYKWNLITEMYCDYKVTENQNIRETGNYANLIIDFAEMQGTAGLPIVGLNLSEKQLKERIDNMKKTDKKYGRMSKMVGAFMIMAVVFVSSLSVYAYEGKQVQHFDSEQYEEFDELYLYSNWEDDGRTKTDIKYDGYEKYINADNVTFFVGENGDIHYNVYIKSYQTYKSCSHKYKSGTIAKHKKDENGGCKTDYYDGKWCENCGHTVYGDCIRTVSYTTCPH